MLQLRDKIHPLNSADLSNKTQVGSGAESLADSSSIDGDDIENHGLVCEISDSAL